MKLKLSCLAIAVGIGIDGCSNDVSESDLPGRYEFVASKMQRVITIESDGQYRNSFVQNGAVVWTDVGSWKSETVNGVRGITFEQFRFGIPGHRSSKGFWIVKPEKLMWGAIKLCFDLDLGHCFERSNL